VAKVMTPRTWAVGKALPKKKVGSPKYRKFWDGSRPQVWMVQASELNAKGMGRGAAGSESDPSQCGSVRSGAGPTQEPLPFDGEWEGTSDDRSWPEVRSTLWSTSSAPSTLKKERVARKEASSLSRDTSHRERPVEIQAPDKTKVVPPWGPERANQDRRDILLQKRLEYRQLLDEQNAKMADQHRRQRVEQAELEKNSIPSLATKTHRWENHTEGDWKALMEEQLAAVACRKGKEIKQREEEQQKCRAHLDKAAAERALHYFSTRRRLKEEVCELTDEWMKVSEEKRKMKDQQRRKELDAEQKALEELMEGMAPPRRLRKPVSLCDYYVEPPKTAR